MPTGAERKQCAAGPKRGFAHARNSIRIARLLTTALRMKPLYALGSQSKRHLVSEHGLRPVRSLVVRSLPWLEQRLLPHLHSTGTPVAV